MYHFDETDDLSIFIGIVIIIIIINEKIIIFFQL